MKEKFYKLTFVLDTKLFKIYRSQHAEHVGEILEAVVCDIGKTIEISSVLADYLDFVNRVGGHRNCRRAVVDLKLFIE